MKKIKNWIIGSLALAVAAPVLAQFAPGQILTAAQLNSAFANVLALSGGTLTGPLTVPTLNTANAQITGGTISGLGTPLPLGSGGTGANNQAGALTAILGSSTVPIVNGGTNATTATSAVANLGLRAQNLASITFNVDNVLGVDSPACGLGTGPAACASIETAYNNIAQSNDWRGFNVAPTIKLTPGQVFTSGLTIQAGQQVSPRVAGTIQVNLDLNGATINPTNNSAIYVRHVPMWLRVFSSSGYGTLSVSGTAGNLVDARGGGVMVEFAGGVNFGPVPGVYPQLSASRYAVISTCPASTCPSATGYKIAGNGGGAMGGTFASAIIGGSIQFEGVTVNIANPISYATAFTQADDAGSSSNWSGMTWQCGGGTCTGGGTVTAPQFIASKAGIVNTNAQPGPFSACQNTALPGSYCGQIGFIGGRATDIGSPTVSGCGTGAIVQNSEPLFSVNLGSGLPSTNGTTVNSCTVTMSTRSGWSGCIPTTNDPGSVSNLHPGSWTGPTSTAPGVVNLTWTATGYDPSGKTIWLYCGQ